MFVQNDANQSNARRLCYCRRSQITAGRLGVSCYQIQPQPRRGPRGFERLSKMEQGVQIGRHIRSIRQRIESPEVNDPLRRGVSHSVSTSFCQSSSVPGRRVKASLPSNSKWSPLPNDAASGAKIAQPRNQRISQSRGIRENKP